MAMGDSNGYGDGDGDFETASHNLGNVQISAI